MIKLNNDYPDGGPDPFWGFGSVVPGEDTKGE